MQYDRYNRQAMIVRLAVILVGVMLALLFAWSLTRAITRPMQTAVTVAHRLAAGDLTQGRGSHRPGRDRPAPGRHGPDAPIPAGSGETTP